MGQKTILIPTDFRVASLNTLRLALERLEESSVNVVLLYCEALDMSITELLFYSPERMIKELTTTDFRDALSILMNRFENEIDELSIELFHGHVQSVFDTLLDTLQIDEIYVAKTYQLHLSRRAFSPMPYIKRSKIPCYELASKQQRFIPEEDKLDNLFL